MSSASEHRVGVFGGSFNPPHVAHVLLVSAVLSLHEDEIDEILVVPTFQHPFAKALASFDDRLEMCRRAMGFLPRTTISDVERELGGESRTLRTLEHLAKIHPTWSLRLIMGADLMLETPKWHAWDAIAKLAPPIVLGRVGVDYPGAPAPVLPAISSTEIRARIERGDDNALEAIVPSSVLEYIRARGLYGRTTG